MPPKRATLKVLVGPNAGDVLSVELGSCRLIGRHLSEHETALMDRDGNRALDAHLTELLTDQLRHRLPPRPGVRVPEQVNLAAFERGPDIVLADDSVSRAHAMLFFDQGGAGVIDLASTNGTWVNGQRVSSAMVQQGDVLALGSTEMSVSWRAQ